MRQVSSLSFKVVGRQMEFTTELPSPPPAAVSFRSRIILFRQKMKMSAGVGGGAAPGVPCRIIRALILFGTTQHHQSAQCEEQSSAVACCMSATSSDDRPPPLLQQPVRLLLTSRPNRTHASRITINVDRRHRLRVLSHGPIPLQTHTRSILLCLSAAQYTSQCRITSY